MSQADGVAGQSDLVRVLAAAAEQVAGAQVDSEADTVTSIVSAAAETVPGADHAGVTLLRSGGEIVSQSVSDDRIRAVDRLQATDREGPCDGLVGRAHRDRR